MEHELFKIELNDTGQYWLKRFAVLALPLLIITTLAATLSLVWYLPSEVKFMRHPAGNEPRNFSRALVFVFVAVSQFVLQMFQLILYYRFAKQTRRAILTMDSFSFNAAFRFLFIQSVLFLVQVLLHLFHFLYNISTGF